MRSETYFCFVCTTDIRLQNGSPLDPITGKIEVFKTHNQVKPSIPCKSIEYEDVITTTDHDLSAILSYLFPLGTVYIFVMHQQAAQGM